MRDLSWLPLHNPDLRRDIYQGSNLQPCSCHTDVVDLYPDCFDSSGCLWVAGAVKYCSDYHRGFGPTYDRQMVRLDGVVRFVVSWLLYCRGGCAISAKLSQFTLFPLPCIEHGLREYQVEATLALSLDCLSVSH